MAVDTESTRWSGCVPAWWGLQDMARDPRGAEAAVLREDQQPHNLVALLAKLCLAGAGEVADHLQPRVHPPQVGFVKVEIDVAMRREIDLVEQREARGGEVEREDTVFGQPGAIGLGIAVVRGEDVSFDPDQAALAHTGHGDVGRAVAVVHVAVVMMGVPVPMGVRMAVFMILVMALRVTFEAFGSAAANGTHHIASLSLIRSSSPAIGTSRARPQSGQGARRAAISTSLAQS